MSDDTQTRLIRKTPVAPSCPSDVRCMLVMLTGPDAGRPFSLKTGWTTIGRGDDADLQIVGDGVSRGHAQIRVSPDGRTHVLDLDSKNGTFLNGITIDDRAVLVDAGDVLQIGDVLLRLHVEDSAGERLLVGLFEAAVADPLTGIANRRYFDERLSRDFDRAMTDDKRLSVLFIDIDRFKDFNDRHGHAAGDLVLKGVAEVLGESLRQPDLAARYGGEEFVVLLPATPRTGAVCVAERLRQSVRALGVNVDGVCLSVTVSVGLATGPSVYAPTAARLLEEADAALYAAKAAGRDRVALAPDPDPVRSSATG